MTLLKSEPFGVSFAYFLVLLSIALWVQDFPNQPYPFNLTDHILYVCKTF